MKGLSKQGIVKAAGVNSIARLLVSVLGFAQLIVLAKIFGLGTEIDALLIAQTLPLLFVIMGETVLSWSFLPIFVEQMEKRGEEDAWNFANKFFTILTLLLFCLTVLVFVFAAQITYLLAPGMSPEGRVLATLMLRIMSPVILLSASASLPATIFNSYQNFTVPALVSLVFGSSVLVFILALSDGLGIISAAIGVLAGLLLQCIILHAILYRNNRRFSFSIDLKDKSVRKTAKLMGPRFMGLSLNRFDVMVDRLFASTIGMGYISALAYADKLVMLFCGLLPLALGKSMMPIMSRLSATGNFAEIKRLFNKSMGMLAFFFLPVTGGLIVLCEPIVDILFKRGAFDDNASAITSTAIIFYSIGLMAFSFNILINGVFYSMQDTLTPIKANVLGSVLNIILDILLIRVFSYAGLALATSIIAFVKSLVLHRLLTKKIGSLGARHLLNTLMRVGTGTLVMVAVMWGVKDYTALAFSQFPAYGQLFGLVLLIFIGLVTYLFSCKVLRVQELSDIAGMLRLRFQRI
ncbi:MAG: murein biosynthesis integral membrane protein MurJ [Thermodesulfobacteriota bacterium]